MQAFTKVLHPATVQIKQRLSNVFVTVTWDGKRLSFTGVEGPMRNGDARGGWGQIEPRADYVPAEGWTEEALVHLWDMWRAWHLNDMRAGCEHQRAEGWDKRPIDPSKPTNTYGKHFPGQTHASWNMLVWVSRDEHPKGLLGHPCPTCGYKYGTAWLHQDVPEEVLTELVAMPDSTLTPAWH